MPVKKYNKVILAMSGKKQSSKNESFKIIKKFRPDAVEFAFADTLKQFCIDVLGLEPCQVYGTDEQKNTPCPNLLWENFPLPAYVLKDGTIYITKEKDIVGFCKQTYGEEYRYLYRDGETTFQWELVRKKSGPMTAREVLQYYGTAIFRRHYPDVWADACICKIRNSHCSLAIITDCRFPNEVEAVHKAGGKVIRLTRNHNSQDSHSSEISLDKEYFDWGKFDFILDNKEMTLEQQSEALYQLMMEWGVIA